MKHELADYEIYPKIFEDGMISDITIKPLGGHAFFQSDSTYLLRFLPMDESVEPLDENAYESIKIKPSGNVLRFKHAFHGEQEHYIRVFKLPDTENRIGNFSIFSLMPDLYSRRPFRGDFHVHTCHSDGREAPAIVAANYRRSGYDFMAVTDHARWQPSLEAIKAYEGVPVDLKLFYGEEIHPPENHIHMVNFGGKNSINEMFKADRERYDREVAGIIRESNITSGINAYEYASCVWCFRQIRDGGGMGIFCHPHWIANVYHVAEKMIDFLFERKPFDAFEVLGGHEVYSNNMQTAYYNEARAKGMKIPIVGSSDSHGTEDASWFNWFSTIVFANDMELESITSAVKELYSVAVECYPGEAFRIYGPYRLVKFAQFLMYEFFPLHDLLCIEEGRLMKDYACGDVKAAEILALMQGRTSALLERCYKG